jgi:hypothetical protein
LPERDKYQVLLCLKQLKHGIKAPRVIPVILMQQGDNSALTEGQSPVPVSSKSKSLVVAKYAYTPLCLEPLQDCPRSVRRTVINYNDLYIAVVVGLLLKHAL